MRLRCPRVLLLLSQRWRRWIKYLYNNVPNNLITCPASTPPSKPNVPIPNIIPIGFNRGKANITFNAPTNPTGNIYPITTYNIKVYNNRGLVKNISFAGGTGTFSATGENRYTFYGTNELNPGIYTFTVTANTTRDRSPESDKSVPLTILAPGPARGGNRRKTRKLKKSRK